MGVLFFVLTNCVFPQSVKTDPPFQNLKKQATTFAFQIVS